ncbi:MAG: 50S ribosomal protein L31e [Candidatus Pacearchaeota archaeon]
MAKKHKISANEREYVINLRREILKVPKYRRTPKAIKAIKQFIAKHMRIPDRDLKKVKLDKYLNEEMWFRGIQNPPTKIKVKAKKSNDIVTVSLSNLPDKLKYKKLREERTKEIAEKSKKERKEAEKKAEEEIKEKAEEKREEEIKQEKTDEKEKEVAVAEAMEKQAEIKAKEQKHIAKVKPVKTERIQRKALQK